MDLLQFSVTELPKAEQEKVLSSIGESDISKVTCLDILTRKLKDQKDFNPCLEKEFLIKFLRNSKFDITKAFNRIKKFYEIQVKFPDFFELCSQEALANSVFNKSRMSPFRLPDNTILIMLKYFQIDLSKISVKEKNYLDLLNCFQALENPLTQMCGVTLLMDVAGFTVSKMLHYNLKYMKVSLESFQGAFPSLWKNVHVVHSSQAIKVAYNCAYPFLTKKIRNRIHFHTDSAHYKDLKSFIPAEVLPEEYGGCLKESDLINSMENIHKKEEYFRKFSPYLLTNNRETKKL